jgi:hypothetical protein
MTLEPADLLFVFAGADARKAFAIRSWRDGAASALAMSVARFEWRRVPGFGLPEEGGLLRLVESTPPPQRLFVLLAEGERVTARRAWKGRWGTWSEAVALAALVRERGVRTVLVCTSGYHLPRVLLTTRRALTMDGTRECRVLALAAPEGPGSPLAPSRRWRSPRAWSRLATEGIKWVVYALGIPMAIERPRAAP